MKKSILKLMAEMWYKHAPKLVVTTMHHTTWRVNGTIQVSESSTEQRKRPAKKYPKRLRNALDFFVSVGKRRPPLGIVDWRESCRATSLTIIFTEFLEAIPGHEEKMEAAIDFGFNLHFECGLDSDLVTGSLRLYWPEAAKRVEDAIEDYYDEWCRSVEDDMFENALTRMGL